MPRSRKSSRNDALDGAITAEDVLGKDVVDPEGDFIGVTNQLFIDPKTLEVLGVSVDKGFLKAGLVIGADHIKEVTEHAVLLKTSPAHRLQGMSVFDTDGARVGTVTDVLVTDEGELTGMRIRPSRVRSKTIEVPASAIDRVERNVLLSIKRKDVI